MDMFLYQTFLNRPDFMDADDLRQHRAPDGQAGHRRAGHLYLRQHDARARVPRLIQQPYALDDDARHGCCLLYTSRCV